MAENLVDVESFSGTCANVLDEDGSAASVVALAGGQQSHGRDAMPALARMRG